jgi:hypothetical protein
MAAMRQSEIDAFRYRMVEGDSILLVDSESGHLKDPDIPLRDRRVNFFG